MKVFLISFLSSSSENLSSLFKHLELPKQELLDRQINTTNPLFIAPLSDHNSININISERQTEINQQNNQNISKLEDILSDISLSTFWEPFKSVERKETEVKSPKIENMISRKDENSAVNFKVVISFFFFFNDKYTFISCQENNL